MCGRIGEEGVCMCVCRGLNGGGGLGRRGNNRDVGVNSAAGGNEMVDTITTGERMI